GQHQLWNAGLALATVAALPQPLPAAALSRAMQHVDWPARLQRLTHGNLAEQLPPAWELWLDGGHNDSAGEVLAAQFATWRREDGDAPRPLHLIFGMLKTKVPEEFLAPLASHVEKLCAVTLENDPPGFAAAELADLAQKAGIQAIPASGLRAALSKMASPETPPGRLLICGSLYLAGKALKENGTKLR
ncbi:MAG: bifunctional folylpolyglutamate synthase/dihydrofolate synthase, partial [Alphaproteobacteria bacterium]|nr:bifunctional folylpolyglutamate synthase/dihydrofolate synthase [Alphaproteobacteria bacterium]